MAYPYSTFDYQVAGTEYGKVLKLKSTAEIYFMRSTIDPLNVVLNRHDHKTDG